MALVSVWWLSIRMLWTEWEIDPQYSYGFLVPILCVALFLQRWRDRPSSEESVNPLLLGIAALPTLGFLLLVQPFYEANPAAAARAEVATRGAVPCRWVEPPARTAETREAVA